MRSRLAPDAPRPGPIFAFLPVLAMAFAAPALAHDFYLLPERSAPDPGAGVHVSLHVS